MSGIVGITCMCRGRLSVSAGGIRYLLLLMLLLQLTACSFQADRPAPVVTVNPPVKKQYQKGGLISERYRVKKGDTLYSISWAANKDFVDIARRNGLKKPYTIYPGQVLNLKLTKPVTTRVKAQNWDANTPKSAKKPIKAVIKQPVATSSANGATKVSVAKKSLDQTSNSAYPVPISQQSVNNVIHKSKSTLPQKVHRWHWPVKGALIGKFSAKEQGNKGIKIAGTRGDRIQAAADGRVVYAGNALRGYGNLVIIKHSDDYLSAYAHADKILVKEKQFVTAGQTVASMGKTGTNRVMLHFEIRYHGKSVDPLKYLPKT